MSCSKCKNLEHDNDAYAVHQATTHGIPLEFQEQIFNKERTDKLMEEHKATGKKSAHTFKKGLGSYPRPAVVNDEDACVHGNYPQMCPYCKEEE